MKSVDLDVIVRDASQSKGALNNLRKEGNLPGVVYGTKAGTTPITVAKRSLINLLNAHGANAIIKLKVNGQTVQAMLKEIQSHPVTGQYWHVDFGEISMTRKIKAMIHIQFVGEAIGAKAGGIVHQGETSVEVECFPQDLPEGYTLDISHLDIGDKLTVADLEEIKDVTILTDPEQMLINVIQPVQAEEETEDEAAPSDEGEQANTEE